MTAYPAIPISQPRFTRRLDDSRLHLRAGNGALQPQQHMPAGYCTFTIPHAMVSTAQLTQLRAFYASNASLVEFVDPISGVTYVGKLTKPPAVVKQHNSACCDVDMYFTGLAGAHWFDFTRGAAFDPRFVITRNSGGGRTNSAGIFEWQGADTPRVDHDPVTRESLGLLMEELSTNKITQSDDIANEYWGKLRCTTPSKSQLIPDNGETLANSYITSPPISKSASVQTWSARCIVESYGYDQCWFLLLDSTTSANSLRLRLSLTDGTLHEFVATGTFSNISGGVVYIGDGRWQLTLTGMTGTETGLRVRFYARDSVETLGDGVKGINISNIRLERNRSTSHIPTAGSEVTRAEETAYIELGNALVGMETPTFYLEFSRSFTFADQVNYFLDTRSGSGNGIIIGQSASTDGILRVWCRADDASGSIAIGSYAADEVTKVAVVYDGQYVRACVNGGAVVTGLRDYHQDGSKIFVGSTNTIPARSAVRYREVRLYQRPLSDVEIQVLTS